MIRNFLKNKIKLFLFLYVFSCSSDIYDNNILYSSVGFEKGTAPPIVDKLNKVDPDYFVKRAKGQEVGNMSNPAMNQPQSSNRNSQPNNSQNPFEQNSNFRANNQQSQLPIGSMQRPNNQQNQAMPQQMPQQMQQQNMMPQAQFPMQQQPNFQAPQAPPVVIYQPNYSISAPYQVYSNPNSRIYSNPYATLPALYQKYDTDQYYVPPSYSYGSEQNTEAKNF